VNYTAVLVNAQHGHARLMAAWREAKAWLVAGHRLVITIRQENRNSAQNAALHAWIGEIAAQKEWAGAKREPETWKRLLVASWLRARGESIEVLPALDGHGVDFVFRRTSTLTKAECSELLEYVIAWAVDNGVTNEDREMVPA